MEHQTATFAILIIFRVTKQRLNAAICVGRPVLATAASIMV